MSLHNRNILVGVTGSIAAYKSADLVRRLKERGAIVRVVMTSSAKEFITPLTMQAVSGLPVHDNLLDLHAEAAMGHIELARWADVVLIAPASANFMTGLCHGEANDLLSAVCLATDAKLVVAPAMNPNMYANTATQQNLQLLSQRNITVLSPEEGDHACGEIGVGRMMEPINIAEEVGQLLQTGELAGRKVLITAGPTREAIDPVRFISNHSSGKMGFALAQAAVEAGAQVTLIAGPVTQETPEHVTRIDVVSAQEMHDAVMDVIAEQDIFIAAAAVADYGVDTVAEQKIKKQDTEFTLKLKKNPDILLEVSKLANKPLLVGFAAETENLIEHARAKLVSKQLDMIVANDVSEGKGFYQDENACVVITKDGEQELPLMKKAKLVRALIREINKLSV